VRARWRWPSALLLAAAATVVRADHAPLRLLALGDSYTIGEDVAEVGRWPVQLAALLRADGIAVDPPTIVARTGWTTDELSAAMDDAELAPHYDLVTLLIGVNNQYRGRPLDGYEAQFNALLERAIELAGHRAGRVLVLSIPDWGATPFAANSARDKARVGAEIDAFNRAAATICAGQGVAFVDITPISREAGAQADMIAADGLHPSAAQYALWAKRALPVAKALLAR
jgi:lysophospholipase L1-like esterase